MTTPEPTLNPSPLKGVHMIAPGKCKCGGDPVLYFVGPFRIACKKCARFGPSSVTIDGAIESWNAALPERQLAALKSELQIVLGEAGQADLLQHERLRPFFGDIMADAAQFHREIQGGHQPPIGDLK